METDLREDRMSVSLAWKDFFGKFGRRRLALLSVLDHCIHCIRLSRP